MAAAFPAGPLYCWPTFLPRDKPSLAANRNSSLRP